MTPDTVRASALEHLVVLAQLPQVALADGVDMFEEASLFFRGPGSLCIVSTQNMTQSGIVEMRIGEDVEGVRGRTLVRVFLLGLGVADVERSSSGSSLTRFAGIV
jgi:hypothetical protein